MKSIQFLVTTILTLFLVSDVNSQNIIKEKSIEFWRSMAYEIFVTEDFDNDGELEFLADANNRKQIIIGTISEGSRVEAVHQSRIFNDIIRVHYLDTDEDGEFEIYVLDTDSDSLYQLAVPTLETVKTHYLDIPQFKIATDIEFGSIVKGEPNVWYIIARSDGEVFTLAPDDFTFIEELPEELGCHHMYIGNFDSDPDNEVLLDKGGLGLRVLNDKTLSTEYTIDGFISDYQVADANKDGIMEIYEKDGSFTLLKYDFSIDESPMEFDDINFSYSDFIVLDVDQDSIDDMLLYNIGSSGGALTIINGSNYERTKLAFPDMPANFSGSLIAIDDILLPESNNLLFSGISLYSLSTTSRVVEKSIIGYGNLTLHGYDHYSSTETKHLLLSTPKSTSGKDIRSAFFFDFEDQNITQEVTPYQISPESNNLSLNNRIVTYNIKGDPLKDLIYSSEHPDAFPFYNPGNQETYNTLTFKGNEVMSTDLDLDGNDELIIYNTNSEYIQIYKSNSNSDWEQVIKMDIKSQILKILQIDNDPAIEFLIYADNQLKIVDSATGSQLELETDFSLDGVRDIAIFSPAPNQVHFVILKFEEVILYNPKSQTTLSTISIPYFELQQLKSFEMVENGEVRNYIIGYGQKLKVFNEILGTVAELSALKPITPPYYSDLIIHNDDKDQYPNVVVCHQYGVDQYEIELEGAYHSNFNLVNHFPKDGRSIGVSTTMFLDFNNQVEISELQNHFSLYYVEDMVPIHYTMETKNNFKFEVIPDASLIADKEVVMTISEGLKSRDLESLNIGMTNENELQVVFDTDGISIAPEINLLSAEFSRAYNHSKRLITLKIESQSDDPIQSVRGAFVGSPLLDHLPIDLVFDETEEEISILLDFFELEPGEATYHIIATSYNGSGVSLEIPIEVVEEEGSPFKRGGVDQYNSFYKPMNIDSNVMNKLWEQPLEDEVGNNYAVVGEGEYIYLKKREDTPEGLFTYLYKLEKITGNVVFKKAIAEGFSQSGDLLLDNGFLYLQIEGSADNPNLTCIDTDNGNLIWETPFRNQNTEKLAPVVDDAYLVMSGGYHGGVYCFDRWTGKKLWFQRLSATNFWEPSIHNSIVYTSESTVSGGEVRAFEINSGELLWEVSFPMNPTHTINSPIIDTANNLLIYHIQEGIYSVSLADQTMNRIAESGIADPNIAFKEGYIYQALNGNTLNKINVLTGDIEASVPIPFSRNEIYIFGSLVFVNGFHGTFLFDAETLSDMGTLDEDFYNMNMVDNYFFVSYKDSLIAYELTDKCIDYAFYNEVICAGGEIEIGDITYSEEGIYSDTIIGTSDCDYIFRLELMIAEEITISEVSIDDDNGSNSGSITFTPQGGNGPYTFEWSNGETSPSISNLASGEYSVTITDQDGCGYIFEYEVPLVNSIGEIENSLNIFPTLITSGGHITVDGLDGNKQYKAAIYCIDGVKLLSLPLKSNMIKVPNDMKNGLYLVVISRLNSNEVLTRKIVVNNLN